MATLRRIKHYLALETFDCDEDTKLKLTEKLKIVVIQLQWLQVCKNVVNTYNSCNGFVLEKNIQNTIDYI